MADEPFDNISITADKIIEIEGGRLLLGAQVTLELPAAPVRYLYSGWQSWSLTAWISSDYPILTPRPAVLNPMRVDPVYAHDRRPNGSWYGAVELPSGEIVFLGALKPDTHVALSGSSLQGWANDGQGNTAPIEWFLASGEEIEIFSRYATLLGERLGKGKVEKPYRVWCSWYSFYTEISEGRLLKTLDDLGDMPFDVFQVDDGWQVRIGEWEPNAKFPSGMQALAERIHASGRKAGLWLAPLLITQATPVFQIHREWLLHDEHGGLVSASINWGERLYALDTTHPAALEWLADLMKKVRSWGYDYAKLDFLYAGALPGKRHVDMPREAAYRLGLKTIREALGEAYLLTCGAPILPSIGLCDGLRIGTDASSHLSSWRDDLLLTNFTTPGARNAMRTSLHRLWLSPLLHTDPDVAYFRSIQNDLDPGQKALLQDLATICDFKATSDPPAWLNAAETAALRAFLEATPAVRRTSSLTYRIGDREVDFAPYIEMPPHPGALTRLLGACLDGIAWCPCLWEVLEYLEKSALKRSLDKNPT
jgi:alpha-galactosidase